MTTPTPVADTEAAVAPQTRFRRLRRQFTRLRPLLGARMGRVAGLVAASIVAGFAEAAVLGLVAQVAASMVVEGTDLALDLGPVAAELEIGTALWIAFGLGIVRLVLQVIIAWVPALISADVQADLRMDLFRSFSEASWTVQSEERDGHFQELVTNQVGQATIGILSVGTLISAFAMFLTLTISAFVVSVPVAIFVLLGAVGMFALLRPLTRWGRGAARGLSQANLAHAGGVSEAVRLAEESKVFGTEVTDNDRIQSLTDDVAHAFLGYQLSARLAQSMFQSVAILLIVAGLAGLYLADAGNIASLGAAVLMLVRAGTYGQQIQSSNHKLNQCYPYLERIGEAIARYRSSVESDGGRPLPAISRLGFAGVSYEYRPGTPVLHEVDFEVSGGEAVGIVGPSGAGKSTLVQILLRLRTPHAGALEVNGVPAQEFDRGDWQQRVSYLSQEPLVFQGTVADNIRYFRDADRDAVEHAARLAGVHDEIAAMPEGYDTVIGQRASAVSGGQRQRICLARALLAKPDVLILDEPTSALDAASEAAIQSTLADLHGQVTLLIVAHRISTLSICDRIIVMEGGQIAGFGPADELARDNAFFRDAIAHSETGA